MQTDDLSFEPTPLERHLRRKELLNIFIQPENETVRSALIHYMEQILFGLHDFLGKHVGITREASLEELAEKFKNSRISDHPEKKLDDVIRWLIEEIAPHAVNVASPYFIGHMTSAIPFFMVHLQAIVTALNQNVVKIETSKIVSIVEREVLAKIHRMIYDRDDAFYGRYIQAPDCSLGGFLEDGTLANMTALWVARNEFFRPKPGFEGVEAEGMAAACRAYDIDRCVVLASGLGHYSLRKSCGVLGIGNANVVPVNPDKQSRLDIDHLLERIAEIEAGPLKTKILAVIGIAGATETGTIDPLRDMAGICADKGIHFHVDAAWGGPTLMSGKYRHLLDGIELADSVTIDGHKQFYMPMGCGMIYFRDPRKMDVISYHATYINRPGSVDLGIRSLEGSRGATSLILGSALEIMGSRGYARLIEHGIDTARAFADEIERRPDFELVTAPRLNILTYRIFPRDLREAWEAGDEATRLKIARQLNFLNVAVQRRQREAGKSFVSRTTLRRPGTPETVVLRSVIMNPMTDMAILHEILDEQEAIFRNQNP